MSDIIHHYSNNQHDSYFTKSKTLHSINDNPSIYGLQELIQQYQSQPELLKLILTSKVEEDKRRAEEAKLRAKELDIYLHQVQPPSPTHSLPHLISNEDELKEVQPTRKYSISSPTKSFRMSPYTIDSHRNKKNSISSDLSDDMLMDQHQQRRHSAAAAMLAMGSSLVEKVKEEEEEDRQDDISSAYPSPVADDYDDIRDQEYENNKPRRRREMQAITKIVETREFPYVDNYFWKNNGNTIQKKTGCKSIYYKCSNSNKGCSVNKTVTARTNGDYLIKYRGTHLPECGKVERICEL
ncbi:hypothetical protein BDB01DRAFT_770862 [Pilobolus umbonatus]|nr:hypothetical protein BDB01DRAFT_770862 [Pilobolus umbonatus]